MEIQRGFRDKLNKYLNTSGNFEVSINISGESEYNFFCLGVDPDNKLSDLRYAVYFNNTSSPNGEISYLDYNNGAKFNLNLAMLPDSINKLVFAASVEGNGNMSEINSLDLNVVYRNEQALTMNLTGNDFHDEKAIISIEIYKKYEWRIAAVARGFNDGLNELLKEYGSENLNLSKTANKPVELKKGQKVNLKKQKKFTGEILINLNWHQGRNKKGLFSLFSSGTKNIDLDLGCLFELKNGLKGSVQALGNSYGSLDKPPYACLDADDRTGESEGGENLRINGAKIPEIKRILVYTFIYEGIANWKEADGVVTVKYPGGSDIVVRLDEYDTKKTMCAIAMLENVNDETLSVEKLVEFFPNHIEMDRNYNWNLKWVYGTK